MAAKVTRDRGAAEIAWPDGLTIRAVAVGRRRQGSVLPASFKATVSGGDLDYELALDIRVEDGEVRCVRLVVNRAVDGPPVTSRRMRAIKLDTYVRYATQLVAKHYRDLGGGVSRLRPLGMSERIDLDVKTSDRGGKRRREPVTDDRLAEVVAAWRRYRGQPAALEVAARSANLSRAHFHRLLTLAVERGLMPADEAPKRRQRSAL